MANVNERLSQVIIQKLGKEGCEYLVQNGELPAIKLTKEELEYVKGGGILDYLLNAAQKYISSLARPQV